jgi:CO/xanthine dehydrogenase FAD-binding subunit
MPDDARGRFLKLGTRHYLVISIAMVAVLLVPAADGSVEEARVAVGACSPVAQRLPALESALRGLPLDSSLGDVPDPSHLAPLNPIDDVRATAGYRLDAALTLVRRALHELAGGAA